jgi:hypothetical protein
MEKSHQVNLNTAQDSHSPEWLERRLADLHADLRELDEWIVGSQAEKRVWMGRDLRDRATHDRLENLDELIRRFADERVLLRAEIARTIEWQQQAIEERETAIPHEVARH